MSSFVTATNTNPTLTDYDDLPRLKVLTCHDVLFVSKKHLMRGVDYRTDKTHEHTLGISILIMKSFDTTRAFIQGLGRVGRFKEKCLRFVWEQLHEPVDLGAGARVTAKLRKAIGTKRKPAVKKGTAAAGQAAVTLGSGPNKNNKV